MARWMDQMVGETKSDPVKPAAYKHVPTGKFGCVVRNPQSNRFEASFPLNTQKRIVNAATRYEAHKDEKGTPTARCVSEGNLRTHICSAYREECMTDSDWFKKRC